MFNRNIKENLIELLDEFRIVYVTGPRQAGKTTLAKAVAKKLNMQYVTLDDQATLTSVFSDPAGYIYSLGSKKAVLDEFQYAPQLVPAIKIASDNLAPDEKGKFLLTGSADIFRSAKTQESLPGHMARIELYPLSVTEIHNSAFNFIDFLFKGDFTQLGRYKQISRQDLAQIVINGGYPEVQSKSVRGKHIWFKSYMEGRLFKDFESMHKARGDYYSRVQALTLLLAGYCGNLIKYAGIANALTQNDKVIKTYMEILELMFIIKRVRPYTKNPSKRGVQGMSKLQFVDTGLACYLLGLKNPEQLLASNFYGGLLESYIAMECYKHLAWAAEEAEIYHFRDKQKNEVDIVLEQDNGLIIGLEVKGAASVSEHDFKGLAKLAESAGGNFRYGVVVYSGSQLLPFKINNNSFFAIPVSILMANSESEAL